MRRLASNAYTSILVSVSPVLVCKFSETEYAFLFPRSSWPNFGHSVQEYRDPFFPIQEDCSIFRGNTETDEFYTSLEEAKEAAKRFDFGGPAGDLDLDKTEGRPYEVLGVLLAPHMEEGEGEEEGEWVIVEKKRRQTPDSEK